MILNYGEPEENFYIAEKCSWCGRDMIAKCQNTLSCDHKCGYGSQFKIMRWVEWTHISMHVLWEVGIQNFWFNDRLRVGLPTIKQTCTKICNSEYKIDLIFYCLCLYTCITNVGMKVIAEGLLLLHSLDVACCARVIETENDAGSVVVVAEGCHDLWILLSYATNGVLEALQKLS